MECIQNNPECSHFEQVELGEHLEVIGTIEPWLISNQSNKKRLMIQSIEVIKTAKTPELFNSWGILKKIISFRQVLIARFQQLLGEPHASLLAGIVLGGKADLSPDFYQALVDTGTLHIIAASGFNISIVAGVLIASLTMVCSRRLSLIGAFLGIVVYVVLAGASPAVIRAGLMGIAIFLAQGSGRDYQAKWLLMLTGGAMLIASPWLIADASFQLSMAATAGILWGVKPIEQLVNRCLSFIFQSRDDQSINNSKQSGMAAAIDSVKPSSKREGSRKASIMRSILMKDFITTISATLATLPITVISFERVSLISPITNTLLIWLVPPLMALGGVMLLSSALSLGLAQIIAWISWPLVTIFILLIEGFAKIPHASLEISTIPWVMGAAFWCLLAAWWAPRSTQ